MSAMQPVGMSRHDRWTYLSNGVGVELCWLQIFDTLLAEPVISIAIRTADYFYCHGNTQETNKVHRHQCRGVAKRWNLGSRHCRGCLGPDKFPAIASSFLVSIPHWDLLSSQRQRQSLMDEQRPRAEVSPQATIHAVEASKIDTRPT